MQNVHKLLQKEFGGEAEVLYETFCEADERFRGFLKVRGAGLYSILLFPMLDRPHLSSFPMLGRKHQLVKGFKAK